jgi:acetoacetyl-CoA synthetase
LILAEHEEYEPLWQPSKERMNSSNMMDFIRYLNNSRLLDIDSYPSFYKWSIDNIEEFWESILHYSGIIYSGNYTKVLDQMEDTIQWAKWFNGIELNFAENLLRHRNDSTAILSLTENQAPVGISYSELYSKVASLASAMRKAGVNKGDRVAGYISNIPEAVISMLAAASIGAAWSSTSPDFGSQGVIERFGQITPKVLIVVDGYYYQGKKFSNIGNIRTIHDSISEIEKIVVIDQIGESNSLTGGKYINWDSFQDSSSQEIEFEKVPFSHPLYIMYSSGTTGKPKCIVHGTGGTLLQHYKELVLHTDLKRDDKILYYTTCGWMMWNWLVSSLMTGATVVLYEGSPAYPDLGILWKTLQDEQINIFGTSPKFLSSCQKANINVGIDYKLDSLRTILSTGSPLSNENFHWVYNYVKRDVQLASIAGGTDIISCFMLGSPLLPVYPGEIQCRGLGMAVEAWDDESTSLTGEKGELVCTKPAPSMPVFFWNDEDGSKYKSAYFDHYHGIWRHGDFISITRHGGVVIYGRSDSTLNRGGIRFGTSEIYRVAESFDSVADSIAAVKNIDNDQLIILFLVLKDGCQLDKKLLDDIRTAIRKELTPRHVPDHIIWINDIPITINGKKVEMAVSNVLNGEPVKNLSALANPESLKQFEDLDLNLFNIK